MARATPPIPSQTTGNQLLDLAVDMMRQGLHEQAHKRLGALQKQFPANPRIPALMGDTLKNLERLPEAIDAYRQALQAGLDSSELLLNLAGCLSKQARVSNEQARADTEMAREALALAQRVLDKHPGHPGALGVAADAERLLGNLLVARDHLRRALAQRPKDANLLMSIGHLHTFEADSPVFEVLEKSLEDSGLGYKERANLYAMLGKAYMDIGEDEQAFANYRQANQLMDDNLSPIKAELERLLTFTRNHYTRPLFEQLAPFGAQDCPQIIVSGMSRSGKSLVESLFQGVAGVHLAGEEMIISRTQKALLEPYQRNQEAWLADQSPATVSRDGAHYLAQLQALGHEDKIKITTVPGDIWNLGLVGLWAPNVPIIFTVRGLLDLGVTGFFQQYQSPNGYRYSYDLHQMGRQIACFEKMMEHWAQVLPNPVYLVDYEALTADPRAVMDNLLSQLGLRRETDYEQIVAANAGVEQEMSPISSSDAPMPITARFVGIGERFRPYLDPMIKGYHTIVDEFPRREPPVVFPETLPENMVHGVEDALDPSEAAQFNWQIPGRIVVLDHGARLLRDQQVVPLMQMDSFGLICFDPAGDTAVPDAIKDHEKLQIVPQLVLGDGQGKTHYICLDAEYNSTLAPLPAEHLPTRLQGPCQVLARLPIQSHALDTIEGLDELDWLLLDERHDNLRILEHGKRVLPNVLLIQIRVAFQPVWQQQASMDALCHWAARNGFRFYGMVGVTTAQCMEQRDDLLQQPRGSELQQAALMFVPDEARMATMSDTERLKLAFILDTVYSIHDLSYTLLRQVGQDLGETYLKARGYFDRRRQGPSGSQLNKVRRALAQGAVYVENRTVQNWAQRFPKDAQVRRLVAEATSWLGKHGEAVHHAAQAIRQAPEDIGIRLSAIEVLLRAGLWWDADYCARQLLAHEPEDTQVQQMAWRALASHPAPDAESVQQALDAIIGFIAQADAEDQPFLRTVHARLLSHAGQPDAALAEHAQALEALGDTQGPQRAIALAAQADSQLAARQIDDSCHSLASALDTWPYSPHTVHAYRHLAQRLGQAESQALRDLDGLHQRIREIWSGYKGESLKYSFGDFGLPYQGFEPLMLPGTRPAMHRLGIYQLEQHLPKGARALDIGCNHGFLLMGLAPHLEHGMGFDISQSCIDVGNAVAEHLGHSHIELSSKPFDEFNTKKQFDLVIACAVHHWIGVPLQDFGAKLHRFCKPGGIVLLESQGIRRTDATEVYFVKKAETMASAGFEVIRKGSLCDDGINYREFWILRK
ncbi:sulfotransferase [Alcaligenaceae bacterium]|nr:sulfotransferase [Alcaligenaceae bacterium]